MGVDEGGEIREVSRPSESSLLVARVKLDKMFVEDMGRSLADLLSEPSLALYR